MTFSGFSGKTRRPSGRGRRPLTGFFSRDKKGKGSPSLATVALVTLGVLLIVIVLQESLPHRSPAAERPQPSDLAALLPAGAQPAPEGWLEIPGTPQSNYVVGYAMGDGSAYAAFIKWDRSAQKYVRASVTLLTAGAARLHGLPTFKALSLGISAPDAVLAVAAGTGGDDQMVLIPKGDTFIIATKVDEAGVAGPAYFPVSGNGADVAFQDVNADGSTDATVTVAAKPTGTAAKTSKKTNPEKSVSVFAWQGDRFRYDKDLSWALTTSARVFPEPAAAPSPAP